ncbi:sensor histidine kinase [Vulgatibacter sp.]|uniref:sensor histidine kinase n=1 Tax=Vulgatibacter sp. TaxID=1971226 RepID=UPI0035674C35
MASLGELLCAHTEELVERWYRRWLEEGPARPDLTEAVLKDHLAVQLRALGEAMASGELSVESAGALWKEPGRLAPEDRVRDDVPIEELVREYAFVVEEIRSWLEERGETVPFGEYSLFSVAIFELTAESARRYATYQAERVSRERSLYLAGLAHQLRTPISVLQLYVQRAERGLDLNEPATLSRLRRTVRRMVRLVDAVLRLERFRPEELPVHPEELSPAQVVDQLVADYEHDAHRKGLRLDVSGNRSLRMEADPDLLADALGNLIENAIKYTEHGFVRVWLEEEERQLVFAVEDSGPGMSPERRDSLFQPVQPGKPGGVGLGLTIARRAALAQGGKLVVESEEGRGTTFRLCLPWKVEARAPVAEVKEA